VSEGQKEEVRAEVRRRHEDYLQDIARWVKKPVMPMPQAPWDKR
jgi:hypothetical protein